MSSLVNIEELFAPAEPLGLAPKRFQHVEALLERGVADKIYPAAVYLVMRHGMIAARGAFGMAQPNANIPATLDTIFDMASVTKPMTATLLLQCVEEGRLHLGMTVADFLPEAEKSPVAKATLRQLATHTSGLPPWKPLYKTPNALTEILNTPRQSDLGASYAYSDLGYILLGEILQRTLGKPLDALAKERIFEPCGMKQTGFRPDAALRPQIAATANCPLREGKTLIGEVHDANAYSMNGVAGHAGLFSNAPDMARFALALRHTMTGAHAKVPPVLGPLARRLAQESQIAPSVGGHSIGWFTHPSGYLPRGDLLSEKTFGHTGFTGTLLMFDPTNDLTLILLTNRVYVPGEGNGILRLRRLFANAVAGTVLT